MKDKTKQVIIWSAGIALTLSVAIGTVYVVDDDKDIKKQVEEGQEFRQYCWEEGGEYRQFGDDKGCRLPDGEVVWFDEWKEGRGH